MKRNIINTLVIGLCAVAVNACGNAANNQPVNADKTATEIPTDSIIQLTKPDTSIGITLMQALAALRLGDQQVPLLNNPVGYRK